ncbi:MAG: CARDB domain-containing protein [Acidobacteriota bacterium]|jgi:hypothetical protein
MKTNRRNRFLPLIAMVLMIGASEARAQPDLVITQVLGPTDAATSESFVATVTIANQGADDADLFNSVTFAVYLSPDTASTIGPDDACVGYAFVDSGLLTAGGSATTDITLFADASVPTGAYYLAAKADSDCAGYSNYTESDETNNVLVGDPITLSPSTLQYDLTVDLGEVEGGAKRVAPGTYTRLDTYLTNLGPDTAPGRTPSRAAYYVRWYLSTDPVIDTGDIQIGSFSGSSLDAGETFRFWADVLVPLDIEKGFYYWGAIVDPTEILNETDETNNAAAGDRVNVR